MGQLLSEVAVEGNPLLRLSPFTKPVGRYLLANGAVAFTATVIGQWESPFIWLPSRIVALVATAMFCETFYHTVCVSYHRGIDVNDEVRKDAFVAKMEASYGVLLINRIKPCFSALIYAGLHDEI